ncbi:chitinase [Streptomyces sp. NPDC058316]|uniref:chitinase n=1 Tax=unclassified Streptomyces TaxID=2593676 RepID=UPI00344629C3
MKSSERAAMGRTLAPRPGEFAENHTELISLGGVSVSLWYAAVRSRKPEIYMASFAFRRAFLVLASAVTLSTSAITAAPAAQAATVPLGVNAPYLYLGWGSPPNPTSVMTATGTKQFTLAFLTSDGTCSPKWDGYRNLLGGREESAIKKIRAAGGDVVASFGGWSGHKLGIKCKSAAALAGAYQKVINAYKLKAIDVNIENTEDDSAAVRQRIVDALKKVKAANSGIKIYVTFSGTATGPVTPIKDLIKRAAASHLVVTGWNIMAFNFRTTDTMGTATIKSADGLKKTVATAYGLPSADAYRRIGISTMNGKTDLAGQKISVRDFNTMLGYAKRHHIARFTFWSVNRDRSCAPGLDADSCSGVKQSKYDYTKVVAQYRG